MKQMRSADRATPNAVVHSRVRAFARSGAARALIVGIAALGFGIACAPAAPTAVKPTTPVVEKLKLQLNFIRNVEHAGILFAEQKGFFSSENLSVEVIPGGSGIDPIQVVAGGSTDIGISAASSLINARSQNIPVKAFASQFQKSPIALTCRTDSGIKTVAQVRGKKVGVKPTARPMFEMLLKQAGLSTDDVQIMPNSQTDVVPIATGRIDCLFTTFAVNEPVSIKQQGVDVVVMLIHDNGLPEQSNVYFTSDKILAEKPDVLARWLRAVRKGWQEALNDPAVTAKSAIDSGLVEGLDITQQTEQARLQGPLMTSGLAADKGLLWLDADAWAITAKNTFEQGAAAKVVDFGDVASADILTRAAK
jgi:NitT/TauT family transport system substrate-binding protein